VTDWDRVRELREKGLDWRSIAADPKVKFSAPPGVQDPGRALKTMYLARQSREQRPGAQRPRRKGTNSTPEKVRWSQRLPFIGLFIIIAGLLWMGIALAYPLAGFLVGPLPPRFPDILLVVIAGAVILGISYVLRMGSLSGSWKKGIAAGIVTGIVISGAMAGAGVLAGVPNLTPITTADYGNWEHADNAAWTQGQLPVVFFYGSEACPYCSASSWALYKALSAFGSVSGYGYSSSSGTDLDPYTPEVALSGSSLASNYISWDPHEDSYNVSINLPAVNIDEQQYVNVYDSGGSIPFVVIAGVYIHIGTFVDPGTLQGSGDQGLPASTVQQDVQSGGNSVASAIDSAAYTLEAYMVKADQNAGITPPQSVTSDSSVSSIVSQIS
jgi:hypothetical protein